MTIGYYLFLLDLTLFTKHYDKTHNLNIYNCWDIYNNNTIFLLTLEDRPINNTAL